MSLMEVKIPDIGDFKGVDVIEVLVKPGDTIAPEDSLIVMESDKASMEVPSPAAGVVKEVKIKVGDKVSEGDLVLLLESSGEQQPSPPAPLPQGEGSFRMSSQDHSGEPKPPPHSRRILMSRI